MLRDDSAIRVHGPNVRKHARTQLAAWSSGMILASGARGPGFNSRSSPFSFALAMFEFELARTSEWLSQRNRHLFIGIVVRSDA